jgi:5-methylcytosine-specific restriction endonuclease McrA
LNPEKAKRIKQKQWNYLLNYLRDNRITYRQYLQSPHWHDVRKRFWNSKLCDGTCEVCGGTERLQVHHNTYKRIGNERLNDLVLLCDDCHKEAHRIEKERPNGILLGAIRRLIKNFNSGAWKPQSQKG